MSTTQAAVIEEELPPTAEGGGPSDDDMFLEESDLFSLDDQSCHVWQRELDATCKSRPKRRVKRAVVKSVCTHCGRRFIPSQTHVTNRGAAAPARHLATTRDAAHYDQEQNRCDPWASPTFEATDASGGICPRFLSFTVDDVEKQSHTSCTAARCHRCQKLHDSIEAVHKVATASFKRPKFKRRKKVADPSLQHVARLDDGRWTCTLCDKAYALLNRLILHVRYQHVVQPRAHASAKTPTPLDTRDAPVRSGRRGESSRRGLSESSRPSVKYPNEGHGSR